MARLAAHNLAIDLPAGWDGAIYRRAPGAGETAHPVVHAANFALPPERGDFGAGVVEAMGTDHVFVSVFEYGPESVGRPLFAKEGLDLPLAPRSFNPNGLQRVIRGQAGHQRFFHQAGRAFCLYVVIGSLANARRLVSSASAALTGLTISSAIG